MSNILTNNINARSGNTITIGKAGDTVSIAGTLSYEDVSSVDSVGVVTAQSGVVVSGGGINVTGVSTFNDDLTANNFTANDLTYPTSDGTDGQVLKTNGSGALSFASVPLLAITDADMWRLQSDQSTNGVITDLVRNPEPSATYIGNGMSVSSGIFTFPSTGKWLVFVSATFVINASDSTIVYIEVTQDNNNWNSASVATDGNNGTGARNGSGTGFHLMDVTDTSQVKVRFNVQSLATGSYIAGNSSVNESMMLFIRLGDT